METELANKLAQDIMPWAVLIVAGVIGLWMKELITDIVASIRWKMKRAFEPGDVVFLDGERATIISIGYRETIFEVNNGRGRVWRHIDNKRIPYVRLERVIEEYEQE